MEYGGPSPGLSGWRAFLTWECSSRTASVFCSASCLLITRVCLEGVLVKSLFCFDCSCCTNIGVLPARGEEYRSPFNNCFLNTFSDGADVRTEVYDASLALWHCMCLCAFWRNIFSILLNSYENHLILTVLKCCKMCIMCVITVCIKYHCILCWKFSLSQDSKDNRIGLWEFDA